jgi:peroxiredoxin
MQDTFRKRGIRLIALSKDSVAEAAAHRQRDGLHDITLLSDPELKVIGAYGLEHHKALEFKSWTVLGVPLGLPTGYKRMAIPTSILVDREGLVRWIDQADDYRIRGDEQRVLQALERLSAASR